MKNNLHGIRKSKGISQEELARMSGLSKRTIERFEEGKNVSLKTALKIMSALNIDYHHLFSEEVHFLDIQPEVFESYYSFFIK